MLLTQNISTLQRNKTEFRTSTTYYEELTLGKDPDAGRDRGQEEKGMAEEEMAGWHHQLNGHEFE